MSHGDVVNIIVTFLVSKALKFQPVYWEE